MKTPREIETLQWVDPLKEKPDADTTVLLALRSGEVIPGFITCKEGTDTEVWQREYVHPNLRDLDEDDPVIAWTHWPAGPDEGLS